MPRPPRHSWGTFSCWCHNFRRTRLPTSPRSTTRSSSGTTPSGTRPQARPHARQAVQRAARSLERPARPARGARLPRGRRHRRPQLRRAAGPAGTARAARAAVRRHAGAGDHRRQLQPRADARRGRLQPAQGHGRQRAPLVARARRQVPVPGARLRPALRDLPGLRHRDDPRAARRRRSGHGPRRAAGRRGCRRSRACGACPSTATRPAPSTPTPWSSGWRRCRRRRRTSASSGTTPTRCITSPTSGSRLPSLLDGLRAPRAPEPRVRVRVDVEDHARGRRRLAVRRVGRQRQVVPRPDGQAHHRRRQDQPVAPRALPARRRRPARADGPSPRDRRAEVRGRGRCVRARTSAAPASRRGSCPRAATSSASTCSTAARATSCARPRTRASS